MSRTLNTTEAAYWLDIPPGLLALTCRRHGVQPVRRVRVGRSTMTVWAFDDVVAVAKLLSPHLVRQKMDGVSA